MKQRLKVASCNPQPDTPYLGLYLYFDVTTYANYMLGEFKKSFPFGDPLEVHSTLGKRTGPKSAFGTLFDCYTSFKT
jgi:hypothetical protein